VITAATWLLLVGAAITAAMVEAPADSALWRLRAEQDAHFFGRAR